MLDSSVALPPNRPRPLKRSASTASLPTPPRTHHKRKQSSGRSRGATDTSSDSELDHDDRTRNGSKKRRLEDEEDEDNFWRGASGSKSEKKSKGEPSKVDSASPSLSPVPALLYRKAHGMTLISPPPSRRQPRTRSQLASPVTPVRSTRTASPPSTPTPIRSSNSGRRGGMPTRDSPNNPFLVSPENPPLDTLSPRVPSPGDVIEKPTMTFVFRGQKREFANPLFSLAPSVDPRSLLAPEDPDFSPSIACPPRLLFHRPKRAASPTPNHSSDTHANPKTPPRRRTEALQMMCSDSGDDESGAMPSSLQAELERAQVPARAVVPAVTRGRQNTSQGAQRIRRSERRIRASPNVKQ